MINSEPIEPVLVQHFNDTSQLPDILSYVITTYLQDLGYKIHYRQNLSSKDYRLAVGNAYKIYPEVGILCSHMRDIIEEVDPECISLYYRKNISMIRIVLH